MRHVAAVEPHDVKHVIRDFAAGPGDLAVENQFVMWQTLDRLPDRGNVLRQVVAGKQLHVVAFLVSEQADAVELSLEDPLRPAEPLLRQRCGHRHEPFGKRIHAHRLRRLHRTVNLRNLRSL